LINFDRVLALQPDFAIGHCNCNNAFHALIQHDEALAARSHR